jgi:hypothetical protein
MNRGRLAGAIVSSVIILSLGAASNSRQSVNYADLGNKIEVIGPLNEPLGKLITIEGALVPEDKRRTYVEANETEALFEVTKVQGRQLDTHVRIDVRSFAFHRVLIPQDQSGVILKGYQTGGFEHIPEEAYKIVGPTTNAKWHFRVGFMAVERVK